MNITFMQTCDPVRYVPLLEIGSLTVKAFIYKFGYSYTTYIGVRRGVFPWQASYNRIPMLMEMVEAGYAGWVCYMDADAYISDLSFDLEGYLSARADLALIAAHSGIEPPLWFDVNNGVFLINLGHAKARELVRGWHAKFMDISDSDLREAEVWGEVPNDQLLFHRAMQEVTGLQGCAEIDVSHPKLLNYTSGRFIRQVLREGGGSIHQRAEAMMSNVDKILPMRESRTATDSVPVHSDVAILEESFIRAVYQTFFLREPDDAEFRSAVKRFRVKRSTMEQEMRDCLRSPEFSRKAEEFLKKFVPRSDLLKAANDRVW